MSDEDAKSWVYAGGIPYELSEGDIVCVFSQYGEILEISLSRDKETGKSRGFGFLKYEDPRSCELAVDNLNGAAIVGRRIKVSFANNVKALKSKKPAIVAPSEAKSLPRVEKQDYNEFRERHQDSPSPSLPPRRHERSKHSHRESSEKRHKSKHRDSTSPKRHKSSSSKHSHRDSKGKRHKSKHHSHSRSPRRDSKHRKHSKHK